MRGVAGKDGAWQQDRAAHFGGWPRLTDAVVGATGAWATYLHTGDEDFLSWSHKVTKKTLTRAEQEVFDGNLFRGCASFMESNSGYPPSFAFQGRKVGATKALSTNVLHYRAYTLAARTATLLNEDPTPFQERADRLKQAINNRLWQPNRGYYAYYEDPKGRPSDRGEALGNALAILWNIADDDQATTIFDAVQPTEHGLPSLWPRYPLWGPWFLKDEYYYHNATVWPFVQGYWAWAAATRGNADVLAKELQSLATLAEKAPTYHEFYRPNSGKPDGSARQLWSAAGYLAMIHKGLLGLTTEPDKLHFRPTVPANFPQLHLTGLPHRNLTLDITITGPGKQIASFTIDGNPNPTPELPTTLTGRHTVAITLH